MAEILGHGHAYVATGPVTGGSIELPKDAVVHRGRPPFVRPHPFPELQRVIDAEEE